MKSNNLLLFLLILAAAVGCSGGGEGSTDNDSATAPTLNSIPITVNGSLCSPATSADYVNKPCVSVTVCTPGTSTCQTVNDILLDTGSVGLRIFKSVLTSVAPAQVPSGSGSLAECTQFADGTSSWGPVMTANVLLGQEPAVTVPIQVIDANFGVVPTGSNGCGTPDQTPSSAGFNGILGVGLFSEDCGSFCASHALNGFYYTCSGSACIGTMVALSNQVQNPVARLPQDNNGVIVQLPAIPPSGKASINGSLVFGIGTRSNNTPSGVTTYAANGFGQFTTVFNNITYSQSFIDSGSNGLYFNAPPSLLAPCTGINTGWYCPGSATPLFATNISNTASNPVQFTIANADTLFRSNNRVFGELGGSMPGTAFDWGLPFFFGRYVYVGIEGKTSSLGTGPYWAY